MSTDEAAPEPESPGEAAARLSGINREDQLEKLLGELTDMGDHAGRAELERLMAEWKLSQGEGGHANPVDALTHGLKQQVTEAMAELTNRPERLDLLSFVAINSEAVSARMRPLESGWGLVQFSDATTTLCLLYSGCAAEGFVPAGSALPFSRLRHAWRAQRTRSLGIDRGLLTGLLRYYYVNQRVFALAAKLGYRVPRRAQQVGWLLAQQAMVFVLCHEAAHHVLEHPPAASAFSPAEDLSACTDSQQRELDADLLGYRAAVRVGEHAVAGTRAAGGLGMFPEAGAALGALIGMLAIYGDERAVFIRSGRTHPSAPVRAARLMGELRPEVRDFSEIFLNDLVEATHRATDFSEHGHRFTTEWLARTPGVHSPLPPMKLRLVEALDLTQSRARENVAADMSEIEQEADRPALDAVRAAVAGDARTALLAWGVPAKRVEAFCDPHRALKFSELVEKLRTAFGSRDLPKGGALAASVLAAQLLSDPLSRLTHP
ncbi:hypothetical protein AB0C21_04200 [Spirillospora sp. NPDC049024]